MLSALQRPVTSWLLATCSLLMLAGCGQAPAPTVAQPAAPADTDARLLGYKLHEPIVGVYLGDSPMTKANLWFYIKSGLTGKVVSNEKSGKPTAGGNVHLEIEGGTITSGDIFLAADGRMYFCAKYYSSHGLPAWDHYGKYIDIGRHNLPANGSPKYLSKLEIEFAPGVSTKYKNSSGWLSTGPYMILDWKKMPTPKTSIAFIHVSK